MDTINSQYASIFLVAVIFIAVSWAIVSCCCCGATYVYSNRYLSTIDETTPTNGMTEFGRSRATEDNEISNNQIINIQQVQT